MQSARGEAEPDSRSNHGSRPARLPAWLLMLGLALGIGVAAGELVLQPQALPADAVASVNGKLISRDAWLRAVAAVASERRAPLTSEDQRHILERLIDEELLVQHGLSLGLIEQDRRLRGELVQDVLAASRAEGAAIDDAQLRRFYDDNHDFFARPPRLRVAAWRLLPAAVATASGTASPAELLRSLLKQRRPIPSALAQPFQPTVPDGLLPLAELRNYLGPELAAAAQTLPVGGVSEALRSGGASVVLQVLERESAQAPEFAEIRDAVAGEYRRRQDEAAVRRLLAELRESGRVHLRELP